MKRDLGKSIEEYKRRFCKGNSSRCAFYCEDVRQIEEISKSESDRPQKYNLIFNALMAGFMVGYRYAKRESKKKNPPANAVS